jgi:hypothetical protein
VCDLASFHLPGDDRPGGVELADGGRQVHQELGHGLVVAGAGLGNALGGMAGVEQAGPGVVEQDPQPVGRQAIQERL